MVVDGHDCLIQAPEDSDQFYFCTPLEESMGIKLTEAYPLEIPHRMRRKTGASGYAMHEGCWILTTRLLDVNVIKAHLKEFINALPWASRAAGRRANFIPPADPLSLLELRAFLAQEEERYRVAKHKQRSNDGVDQLYVSPGMPLSRVFMQVSFTQGMDLRSGITSSAARFLPSELILQIMDYLPGSQEILHLMLVFPFWAPKIPYFYWRTRFRKELMLERDELPDLDALNWQRAYCGLDYLYGASQAIRGRRRILAEIQPIK